MRRLLLFTVPLLICLAGCAKPAPYIGKWKYADAVPKTGDAKQDAVVEGEAAKFILELKDDKTWSATPPGEAMNGTYTVSGNSISLMKANPKTDDDKKPATAAASEDGKTLTFTPPDGSGAIKFSKMPS